MASWLHKFQLSTVFFFGSATVQKSPNSAFGCLPFRLYSTMSINQLKREMFSSWQEYYWTYQYKLAEEYYIPLFEKWGIQLSGKTILDVGCGDGGFTTALADAGAKSTGVEIRDFGWGNNRPGLRFLIQDILAPDAIQNLGTGYDIILLRDVIEHIPLDRKAAFLEALSGFSNAGTQILITFPPFYSPFGLHQQTLLKSFLKKIPFLGWVPELLLIALLKLAGETENAIDNVREIRSCRMTLYHFKRLIARSKFQLENEKYFFVRPSHELRYGWRMRESNLSNIPLLREILILGSVYQLSPRPVEK